MRVLLVANTLPPDDISGVGEQVLQLAAGLRTAGHEVRVLGRGRGGAHGPKLLFPLTVTLPFLRALRRFRPHVVQVHESDGALAAWLAAVAAPLLDPVPVVVGLLQVSYVEEIRAVRPLRDGGRVLGRPGAVERRFRRWKAPLQVIAGWLTAYSCDLLLAPSGRTAAELRRDYGVDDVAVLPNTMGAREIGEPRRVEPVAADGFWLFVGRLRLRKGVEVLLEALAALDGAAAAIPLWIAGDGEHRAALEETARRLRLGERVRFLGRCTAEQVRDLLDRSRALVVPSIYEGMPLVVLEAMERGTPVVASAVSGIPEVVRDRVTGWLVPAEDVGALSAALRETVDAEECRRRGAAGRSRLDERYRPRVAVHLWEERVLSHPALVGERGASR